MFPWSRSSNAISQAESQGTLGPYNKRKWQVKLELHSHDETFWEFNHPCIKRTSINGPGHPIVSFWQFPSLNNCMKNPHWATLDGKTVPIVLHGVIITGFSTRTIYTMVKSYSHFLKRERLKNSTSCISMSSTLSTPCPSNCLKSWVEACSKSAKQYLVRLSLILKKLEHIHIHIFYIFKMKIQRRKVPEYSPCFFPHIATLILSSWKFEVAENLLRLPYLLGGSHPRQLTRFQLLT